MWFRKRSVSEGPGTARPFLACGQEVPKTGGSASTYANGSLVRGSRSASSPPRYLQIQEKDGSGEPTLA